MFSYHASIITVSGSINHQVCLWNPYVVTKPVGLLVGHMAPIVQIAINKEDKNQAISFSKDKVCKWTSFINLSVAEFKTKIWHLKKCI